MASTAPRPGQFGGLLGPAVDCAAAVESDTVNIVDGAGVERECRAISIGTAGTLKITTHEGNEETLDELPAGFYPIVAKRIWSTGTTALNINVFF